MVSCISPFSFVMFVMCSLFCVQYFIWHNNMHAGLLYFVFIIPLTVQPFAIAMHVLTDWVFCKIEMLVVERKRYWICWYGWNFIIIMYKVWTIVWIVSYRMCCCCFCCWTRFAILLQNIRRFFRLHFHSLLLPLLPDDVIFILFFFFFSSLLAFRSVESTYKYDWSVDCET